MFGRSTRLVLAVGVLLAGCGDDAATTPTPADGGVDGAMRPDGATDAPLTGDAPRPGDAGDVPGADVPPPPQATAILEIHALDLWAQPIPVAERTFALQQNGSEVTTREGSSPWIRTVDLTAAGSYEVALSAPDHRPLMVQLTYDGSGNATGLTAHTTTTGAGLVLTHTLRNVGTRTIPLHSVYLGLRHQWFSAQGRPARRGNNLRLLQDGEEAWAAVSTELRAARTTAHMATWWWDSTFELTRDAATHPTLSAAQRQPNTILSVLEASSARKRILVGEFLSMDGSLANVTTDAALRAHGTTAGDNFEHMGQYNPTRGAFVWQVPPFRFGDRVHAEVPGAAEATFDPEAPVASELGARMIDTTDFPTMLNVDLASYHQKFAIIDDRVAFIGGMNLRPVDWDTSQHRVFEPRRMNFTSSTAARAQVVSHDHLPDNGPRKDYMVRIEGPIVRDAEDVFHRRWSYLLETRARFSPDASDFTVPPAAAPIAGGVTAQVTATLPTPFNEYAIAESWINAVQNAHDYIYIEDQYFRIPMLTDVIQRRMEEVPSLRLVVITKPINEWTDPGCAWTYRNHMQFSGRYPGRYMLLQLRSFDTQITFGIDETDAHFVDMDTHAKILIVDDVFLSVGSCNKNNRGIVYEGEMNIAVLDRTWVRAARRRIVANLLQTTDTIPDEVSGWWDMITRATTANDAVRARWTAEGDDLNLNGAPLPPQFMPHGFVYTLSFGPVRDCLIESIGPDVV